MISDVNNITTSFVLPVHPEDVPRILTNKVELQIFRDTLTHHIGQIRNESKPHKLSKVFEDQGNRDCFKYMKLQFLKIWLLGHPVQFVFSTVKSALPVLWSLSFRFWALVKTMGKHTRELSYWHFVHIYEISDYRILNITRGHKMRKKWYMKAQRLFCSDQHCFDMFSWTMLHLMSIPSSFWILGWPSHSASLGWIWKYYGWSGQSGH